MKRFHQSGAAAGRGQFMTLRAAFVFGGFIFDPLSVLVEDVVADIARFDSRIFIMRVMKEYRRRPLRRDKCTILHGRDLILGMDGRKHKHGNRKGQNYAGGGFFHSHLSFDHAGFSMTS
jgi:hypothetical protein